MTRALTIRWLVEYARRPLNLALLVLVPVVFVSLSAGALSDFADILGAQRTSAMLRPPPPDGQPRCSRVSPGSSTSRHLVTLIAAWLQRVQVRSLWLAPALRQRWRLRVWRPLGRWLR